MKHKLISCSVSLLILLCVSYVGTLNARNDSLFSAPVYLPTVEAGFDWLEKMEEMGILSVETDEEVSADLYNSTLEELEELRTHPLNLNQMTKVQLERFPFLSDFQIEKLLYYVYVHGAMESIYELQLVEGMDRETIAYLLPYVDVAPVKEKQMWPSFKTVSRFGMHEFTTRLDLPLYKRQGYRTQTPEELEANPNKHYLGPPWYHSLRYSFKYGNRIYMGITAEKDAGEPFFSGSNKKGYDSYSFYFFLQDIGRIQSFALGKYRASFGQGLLLGTNFLFGKGTSLATLYQRTSGLKKHASTDEYNYFRGIGLTYNWSTHIRFSAFYSHRSLDGIADETTLTSITTTGKHTIPREVSRKNAAVLQTAGGNYTYLWRYFQLGVNGIYYEFDKSYNPQYRPYNRYYFRGKRGWNLSVDYKYHFRNSLLTGEIATDPDGNMAMIHVWRYLVSPAYQFVGLYRYYDKKYKAFYGHGFSEGGKVQNENGLYLGAEIHPLKYWKFTGYVDFFRFPYLKYRIDTPSSGFDGMVRGVYTPSSTWVVEGYYRYKQKKRNHTNESTGEKQVLPFVTHQLRVQGNYHFHPDYKWKTVFQYRQAGASGFVASHGFLCLQSLSYRTKKLPLTLDFQYSFFNTDDYDTRVYAYEKGLLHSYSTPSYYGKGNRFSVVCRYDFANRLTLLAKYGQTVYSNRDRIGSGLEEIRSRRKADLYFQLRYKF